MLIRPATRMQGEVTLPGDKSISHRAAMLAAMAEGETQILNFAASEDCASTLACLRHLGVHLEQNGTSVLVQGVGKTGFIAPTRPLDCGNSGTTMRLLAGVLSGQEFESILTGDDSLRKRPMTRIAEPLTAMGARVASQDGRAPLTIHGATPLKAIEYVTPVPSAQIKSCVLLAGLHAAGTTSVIESVPTRDHTERMLRWFGLKVSDVQVNAGRRISVPGDKVLRSNGELLVPGDMSAAAFFIIAAACMPESDLRMNDVGLNPNRSTIIDVVADLGGTVSRSDRREENNEPVGTVCVRGRLKRQRRHEIKGALIAGLIDELPILAVFGTQIESGLEVRDASELRVKESDRISAIVENLRRMGADVDEFDDGFRVRRSKLSGSRVDSFGDHRIAMAFAVAGLLAEGETQIDGAECAAVSFPGFFDVLDDVAVYK